MRVHARLFATGTLAAALVLHGAAQQPAPPQPAPASAQPQQQPPPPAQPPPAGQRPPVIRSGINFVSVDVIVTDKKSGEVVLDLKQEDFDVREDKRPQKVETFDVVKIDALVAATNPKEIRSTYDEESEARQPNVRLFVVLLDDYHVRRGNDLAVKKPLIDFVSTQLAPQDMVAFMYPLTPVTALTFTRNRDSMIAAINKFEGRKGLYEPRNEFEERYAYYPVQTVEKIRNDVTMDALKGAAVRLGGMRDGRKSIIFVSEGFTSTVPAQLNEPVAAMPGIAGPRPQPNQNIQDPRADSQRFFNQAEQLSRLREVYDTVNRNNTSIYAVDPRGLAVFEYDINQRVGVQQDRQDLNASIDSLHVLANNTDGRAIVNRNDLAAGMKQIMRDASGYYLLGYTSSAAPTDGKFHSIEVRVKRPSVEVRARKGYYAYTAEDAARATAPPKAGPPPDVANALNKIVEPNRAGLPARFWTGTARQPDGKTRVTFVWEPLGASADARVSDAAARVVLTATGADGSPLFRGPVGSADAGDGAAAPASGGTAATTGSAAAPSPAGAAVTFAAPPGQIDLRMVVENARGQVIDTSTQSLTVPDYARTQVSFSTPRLYRARTAREALLVRNNADAPPTATREFSRAERLLVRLDAYAAGGGAPEVTARLLNRAGTAMADVPIQAAEGKPYLIDFPLASLAAGEYIIQVNAKTASGAAQEMIAFKVGT
ncbi:MAG TPA: VWA domain-containing protein [Vicinamibacterales bacterium]|nr:VWA domain-containing protein [Vicinamibacterales bacterium]